MRLLTNGIIMVMIVGDRPETVPVPLYEDQVDEEMDWEKQNPKITSLAQIKAKWPYLFDRDNLAHIPNLKFVETNHHDYEMANIVYSDGRSKHRPHFLDYTKELNQPIFDEDDSDDETEFKQILDQIKGQ